MSHIQPSFRSHLRPGTRRAERGAVIPMMALTLTIIITMASFAVDLGRLRTERRDLQADADAIAMDAVQALNGQPAPAALASALVEANLSAVRNHLDQTLTTNEVQVGTWDVASQTFTPMTGASQIPDTVQVTLRSSIPMHFDLSADNRSVQRVGVAVSRAMTRGELGSVLAGVQQNYDPSASCEARLSLEQQLSFMNSLYTEFLDIDVSGGIGAAADIGTGPCQVTGPSTGLQLDAVSWRGLAFTDVNLDDVATVMGVGSKDALFNGTVDARDFLQASATALQNSSDAGDVAAGTMLGTIATEMDSSSSVNLNDIVALGTGGTSAAAATVNVLHILSGTAMLVNGENLASAAIPVDLPFVADTVNTRVSVIEPPQTHLDFRPAGAAGPHTSQVRVAVDVPLQSLLVDFGLVGGLLGALGVQTTTGNLSFVVEAARADAVYDDIACARDGQSHAVTMSVDTGAVTMSFGTVSNTELEQSGEMEIESHSQIDGSFGVSVPLVGTVSLDLGAVTNVEETVDYAAGVDITGLSEAEINLLGARSAHTFTGPFPTDPAHRYPGGITGTRLSDETYASITYNAASSGALSLLGLTQVAVEDLVRATLDPIVQDLGTQIIEPLLSSLGVTLAGADGKILGVSCQVPALANRG